MVLPLFHVKHEKSEAKGAFSPDVPAGSHWPLRWSRAGFMMVL